MKESELAEKFIEYFNEHEIYKEVPCNGYIDFMAVKPPIRIAVEVKTNFSFKVMEQAYRNEGYANYCYIAVPDGGDRVFAYELCRMLGIGVLEYREYEVGFGDKTLVSDIIERVKPKLQRNIHKVNLLPYMKKNVAGVPGGRVTPFMNTVTEITSQLKRHDKGDGVVFDEIMKRINSHYRSISSAKSSLYNMCRDGVITEFRIEKGKFFLNAEKPKKQL